MIGIHVVKERFIELSLTDHKSELEERRLIECKTLLKKHYEYRAWKLGQAMNFLHMAHATKDWDWVKQLGSEMDQTEKR